MEHKQVEHKHSIIGRTIREDAKGVFKNKFPAFVVDAIFEYYLEAIRLEEAGIVRHFLE